MKNYFINVGECLKITGGFFVSSFKERFYWILRFSKLNIKYVLIKAALLLLVLPYHLTFFLLKWFFEFSMCVLPFPVIESILAFIKNLSDIAENLLFVLIICQDLKEYYSEFKGSGGFTGGGGGGGEDVIEMTLPKQQ